MRERGRYQIQFMKTRSSSGVGTKVDLDFNIESLRITDPGEEGQESENKTPASNIMSQIKGKQTSDGELAKKPNWERATGTPAWEQAPKVSAEGGSTKLRQMLSSLKSNNI